MKRLVLFVLGIIITLSSSAPTAKKMRNYYDDDDDDDDDVWGESNYSNNENENVNENQNFNGVYRFDKLDGTLKKINFSDEEDENQSYQDEYPNHNTDDYTYQEGNGYPSENDYEFQDGNAYQNQQAYESSDRQVYKLELENSDNKNGLTKKNFLQTLQWIMEHPQVIRSNRSYQ